MNDLAVVFGRILKDIQVDMKDEFDKNFERQGFFSEKWERRKSPLRPGRATLINTGGLRRSVLSRVTADGVTFYSTHPAAEIHNEGGEIVVTARMKAYFRYRFYKACKGKVFKRKKGEVTTSRRLTDGSFYAWTEKLREAGKIEMGADAEFWRAMALMKVGRVIKIPKRQFLGASPEVERAVTEIIEKRLSEYFNNEFKLK